MMLELISDTRGSHAAPRYLLIPDDLDNPAVFGRRDNIKNPSGDFPPEDRGLPRDAFRVHVIVEGRGYDIAATQACAFDGGAADADDNYQQNGGGDRRINDDDSDTSSDGDEPLLGVDAAPAPAGALDRALRAPRGPPAGAAAG